MYSDSNPGRRSRTRRRSIVSLLGIALVSTLAVVVFGPSLAASQSPTAASLQTRDRHQAQDVKACGTPSRKKAIKIATAKLIVEYNATDRDLGVHGQFDDKGWAELCVWDPNGRQVLAVKPQWQLKDLSMASVFFESREPPLAAFSFRDLRDRFPEGLYQVRGVTFDGKRITGSADFTHAIPAPPTVTSPADASMVPIRNLVIEWKDVTKTVDGRPVAITGYEVIVTKEDHNDPHGFSRPVYDVHVPADRNRLAVPVEFLEPDTKYELEVLALEKSGNQTIAVSFFTTR